MCFLLFCFFRHGRTSRSFETWKTWPGRSQTREDWWHADITLYWNKLAFVRVQSTCSLKICFTIFVFCLRDASVSKNTNQFLVFVFLCFRYKKTHKHKKHIGSLLQFYCWKRKTKKIGQCVFVFFVKKTQKHKNT